VSLTAPVVAPVFVAPTVQAAPVSAEPDYVGHDTHNYDFLDFEDGEQFDGTQSAGDDFHFGGDAAANNQGQRHMITMDVFKVERSMAVFEGQQFEAYNQANVGGEEGDAKQAKGQMYEINIASKTCAPAVQSDSALFNKLVTALSASTHLLGANTPESSTFKDMFAQRSKEELSKVLSLSLACICSQISDDSSDVATSPRVVSSLNVPVYISKVLKNSQDFIHVLQDMTVSPTNTPVTNHTYDQHNSKQILNLARQVNSAV
jgi:hypothetical protein